MGQGLGGFLVCHISQITGLHPVSSSVRCLSPGQRVTGFRPWIQGPTLQVQKAWAGPVGAGAGQGWGVPQRAQLESWVGGCPGGSSEVQ